MDDEVLAQKARLAIDRADYTCGRVWLILPPVDTGGEMTVCFRGELRREPTTQRRPLTAYIRDVSLKMGEAVVVEGW